MTDPVTLLAEQSAENLLVGMEIEARQNRLSVQFLGDYKLDCDDLHIQHQVNVRYSNGEYRYLATDMWGNLDFSTRDKVKDRIASHKARRTNA
jgi:hypothetical protein